MDALFPRPVTRVAPGAVHVPDWLDADRQRGLLAACREWARPPAGLRSVTLRGGARMSVRQVSLGRHWGPVDRCPSCALATPHNAACPGRHSFPYAYGRTVFDGDGAPVKPFPAHLDALAQEAVAAAYGPPGEAAPGDAEAARDASGRSYDIALLNFYQAGARMGMHRDEDERSPAPVVSVSLGDSCVFRFGNLEHRGRPWTDVTLRSGDLFVFGGPSRAAFHGVPRTEAHSAPAGLGLTGRLNLTLRVSGF
ncbi:alpha-ketoglutarate-dependent dioxygenase AlkB family protein [Streptomyces sp. NPDC059740]|uniref:alpha-ketoglutarate-dependent dioxygenase AlkB family protein n=1 Tax=Streptomyces sp. NPDC059740 TaxID=3346926 RepID=UPI003648099A